MIRCCWCLISPKVSPLVSSDSLISHGLAATPPLTPAPPAISVDLLNIIITILKCFKWALQVFVRKQDHNKLTTKNDYSNPEAGQQLLSYQTRKCTTTESRLPELPFLYVNHHFSIQVYNTDPASVTFSKVTVKTAWLRYDYNAHLYNPYRKHICTRHITFSILYSFEYLNIK